MLLDGWDVGSTAVLRARFQGPCFESRMNRTHTPLPSAFIAHGFLWTLVGERGHPGALPPPTVSSLVGKAAHALQRPQKAYTHLRCACLLLTGIPWGRGYSGFPGTPAGKRKSVSSQK